MRPSLNALRAIMENRSDHSLRNGFFKGGILGAVWEAGDTEVALSYLVDAQSEINVEMRKCLDQLEALRARNGQELMEYHILTERMRCLRWFNGEIEKL